MNANKSPERETSDNSAQQPKRKGSTQSNNKKKPKIEKRKCYFCNEEWFMSRKKRASAKARQRQSLLP